MSELKLNELNLLESLSFDEGFLLHQKYFARFAVVMQMSPQIRLPSARRWRRRRRPRRRRRRHR